MYALGGANQASCLLAIGGDGEPRDAVTLHLSRTPDQSTLEIRQEPDGPVLAVITLRDLRCWGHEDAGLFLGTYDPQGQGWEQRLKWPRKASAALADCPEAKD